MTGNACVWTGWRFDSHAKVARYLGEGCSPSEQDDVGDEDLGQTEGAWFSGHKNAGTSGFREEWPKRPSADASRLSAAARAPINQRPNPGLHDENVS
jgi:hypothetical protein